MPPIVNCTFVRNVGGLVCDSAQSLNFAITNCVFWGNTEWTCEGAKITEGGYGILSFLGKHGYSRGVGLVGGHPVNDTK